MLIPSGLFPDDCWVIHIQVPYIGFRLYGVLNNIFTLVFACELWSLFLAMWNGFTWWWRYGSWVWGWKELIRRVALGCMKVVGCRVLGQHGWNFNFCKVWSAAGSPVKATMPPWDFWELQGLVTRPDHLRVPSMGKSVLHLTWHWHAFKNVVGRVGVAAWTQFGRDCWGPAMNKKSVNASTSAKMLDLCLGQDYAELQTCMQTAVDATFK